MLLVVAMSFSWKCLCQDALNSILFFFLWLTDVLIAWQPGESPHERRAVSETWHPSTVRWTGGLSVQWVPTCSCSVSSHLHEVIVYKPCRLLFGLGIYTLFRSAWKSLILKEHTRRRAVSETWHPSTVMNRWPQCPVSTYLLLFCRFSPAWGDSV